MNAAAHTTAPTPPLCRILSRQAHLGVTLRQRRLCRAQPLPSLRQLRRRRIACCAQRRYLRLQISGPFLNTLPFGEENGGQSRGKPVLMLPPQQQPISIQVPDSKKPTGLQSVPLLCGQAILQRGELLQLCTLGPLQSRAQGPARCLIAVQYVSCRQIKAVSPRTPMLPSGAAGQGCPWRLPPPERHKHNKQGGGSHRAPARTAAV